MLGIKDLPQDLFYQICFYLRINDLIALSSVCVQFCHWLSRQSYWKWRSQNLLGGTYPCLPGYLVYILLRVPIVEKTIDWVLAGFEREKCCINFGENTADCIRLSRLNVVSHGIDALHIPLKYPYLLFMGDRGRMVSIFSFKTGLLSNAWLPIFTEHHSHSGWIWTINSTDDTVITGSWDGALRVWKLTNSGLAFQSIYQLSTPVLCSSFLNSNTLAVGTHDRDVYLLDIRSFEHNLPGRLRHKKAVLCMDAVYENGLNSVTSSSFTSSMKNYVGCSSGANCGQMYVEYDCHSELSSITGSEENFENYIFDPLEKEHVVLDSRETSPMLVPTKCGSNETSSVKQNVRTDLRCRNLHHPEKQSFSDVHLITGSSDQYIAGWDVRNVSQPVHKHKLTRYPRKLSLLDKHELWVAEPPDLIHVFDVRDNQFNCVHTNQLSGWNRGFGGLKATIGCVFAAGLHGSVEAYHPTYPILPISKQPLAEKINALPTSLDYHNDVLVVGSGNGSVYVWSSVDRFKSLTTSN
ncbi:hypothetical protein MN116_001539 [Schistosoma mekongi]|uniref:F-box domain-containing protein n=1 Tax=Schistosoma mekongi TaxID=38744 RepID=A0AAE1ZI44_SCHME|nr:hypothetical protein MN116_001539 [Schistosoma mekongi]